MKNLKEPWEAGYCTDKIPKKDYNRILISNRDNKIIAKIQKSENAEYHARLISAAPEMLKCMIGRIKLESQFHKLSDVKIMFEKEIAIIEKVTEMNIEEVLNEV